MHSRERAVKKNQTSVGKWERERIISIWAKPSLRVPVCQPARCHVVMFLSNDSMAVLTICISSTSWYFKANFFQEALNISANILWTPILSSLDLHPGDDRNAWSRDLKSCLNLIIANKSYLFNDTCRVRGTKRTPTLPRRVYQNLKRQAHLLNTTRMK